MINQMVAELKAIEVRTRRAWESEAAERANNRDYNISPESRDALERGDRQRKTGVYERSNVNLITCAWCFKLVPDDEVCGCRVPCQSAFSKPGMFGKHLCGLDRGHKGNHQCVAIAFCNTTWDNSLR